MDKAQLLEIARKVFDALNAGKLVATKGALVDAVRVGNDGRLYCYKFDAANPGRCATIDATDAEIVVVSKTETLQTGASA